MRRPVTWEMLNDDVRYRWHEEAYYDLVNRGHYQHVDEPWYEVADVELVDRVARDMYESAAFVQERYEERSVDDTMYVPTEINMRQ